MGQVCTNKAKIHMWRMIGNGLAVGAELHQRRIKLGFFLWCMCQRGNCLPSLLGTPTFSTVLELVALGKRGLGGNPSDYDGLPVVLLVAGQVRRCNRGRA